MSFYHSYKRSVATLLVAGSFIALAGCKKMIAIDAPINSTGNETTFKTDAGATSALMSVYAKLMQNTDMTWSNGGMTVYSGLLSDELKPVLLMTGDPNYQYYSTRITVDNGISDLFWADMYKTIFFANSVMEGAAASTGEHFTDSVRTLIAGETRAARAFCYYYLVNMFGDVPMPLTSDITKISRLKRSSVAEVKEQIISDLSAAADLLPNNYSASGGEKLRINKLVATALLSRAYLFNEKWGEAIASADKVINSGQYSLATLDNTFKPNSSEAIWQLKMTVKPAQQVLFEPEAICANARSQYLPPEALEPLFSDPELYGQVVSVYFLGTYVCAPSLIESFEPGDQRKLKWLDSLATPPAAPYYSKPYYFSVKHEKFTDPGASIPAPPYYNVIRLAELYLIRAEAKAQLGDINGAAADLNMIRKRAGLPNTTANTKTAMLAAIQHERQTEMFCEWGARFIDLKRYNKATEVLGKLDYKQPWSPDYLLLPIPKADLISNSALTQNPGY